MDGLLRFLVDETGLKRYIFTVRSSSWNLSRRLERHGMEVESR
jgi:hypothetical protein